MFLQEHKPTMWGSITQKVSWLLKLKTLTFSYGILFRMLGGLNKPKLSASYKILFLNLSDPVLRLCLWTSSVRNRNISNFWDIKTYPNSCFSTDTTVVSCNQCPKKKNKTKEFFFLQTVCLCYKMHSAFILWPWSKAQLYLLSGLFLLLNFHMIWVQICLCSVWNRGDCCCFYLRGNGKKWKSFFFFFCHFEEMLSWSMLLFCLLLLSLSLSDEDTCSFHHSLYS